MMPTTPTPHLDHPPLLSGPPGLWQHTVQAARTTQAPICTPTQQLSFASLHYATPAPALDTPLALLIIILLPIALFLFAAVVIVPSRRRNAKP